MCIADAARAVAAPRELDQHADLVRRRMGVRADDLARVRRLVALGADDDDVLAQLGGDVDPSSSSMATASGAVAHNGLEHLLRGVPGYSFFDTGRFPSQRPPSSPSRSRAVADEALRRLATARLAACAIPRSRRMCGRLQIAVRLLERPLAVHHRRAVASRSSLTSVALDLVMRSPPRPARPRAPRPGVLCDRLLDHGPSSADQASRSTGSSATRPLRARPPRPLRRQVLPRPRARQGHAAPFPFPFAAAGSVISFSVTFVSRRRCRRRSRARSVRTSGSRRRCRG